MADDFSSGEYNYADMDCDAEISQIIQNAYNESGINNVENYADVLNLFDFSSEGYGDVYDRLKDIKKSYDDAYASFNKMLVESQDEVIIGIKNEVKNVNDLIAQKESQSINYTAQILQNNIDIILEGIN